MDNCSHSKELKHISELNVEKKYNMLSSYTKTTPWLPPLAAASSLMKITERARALQAPTQRTPVFARQRPLKQPEIINARSIPPKMTTSLSCFLYLIDMRREVLMGMNTAMCIMTIVLAVHTIVRVSPADEAKNTQQYRKTGPSNKQRKPHVRQKQSHQP
ncbi:hypothetical protein BJ508DRAFT_313952 [Ascobolus immersus RN42]|uniref:Transmembrane protein n=1 Tax=Ascobolus immersus RN42 TaxID=1160509 RepID=A0A3N4HL54_ASCIM|nr:hypothetical protein BJ508DRAFT_313952 [Ascobolus immersus RN42]